MFTMVTKSDVLTRQARDLAYVLAGINPGRRFAVSRDGCGVAIWSNKAEAWRLLYAWAFVGRWVCMGNRQILTHSLSEWIEVRDTN